MSILTGLVTGTLGYSLKRDFLANAIAFREIETFNYEIYSVDFAGFSATQIQNQIAQQFASIYSGDINVTVFGTQNTFQFPSDSLRATRFNVSVEVKKPLIGMSTMFPELGSGYYAGLDSSFWSGYGQYLLDFKEAYGFSTNSNGNKEYNHELSFGLQTGWVGSSTQSGRKTYAQTIASGILSQDKNTTFGISTMIGQISGVGDTGLFRNYFAESYDLMKNVYSFSKRREQLSIEAANAVVNLNNSINLGADGTVDVLEKATSQGKIEFTSTKANLEAYLTGAYNRCSGIYTQFYNTNVIIQDPQYNGQLISATVLPLINTPVRTIKNYDARSLSASYEVAFTNNPNFSGDGTITSQILEFSIDGFNKVEASHSFDFGVNKIIHDSSYFSTLMANTTGTSPSVVSSYYVSNFPGIYNTYPNMNLIKKSASIPNIKAKGSAKFFYSNNPSFFVTINGMTFNVLDYTVEDNRPVDIVNEYKVINRPTKKSVLSYGYQTEKGNINVNIKTSIGKQTQQFYPDGVGSFATFNGYLLSDYLQAIYKFGGQLFLSRINFPTIAFNWFISDSKYSFDSDGNLNVQLNYTYTYKTKSATALP